MDDLERPKLKLGIIPLVDCAPIVLAEELGAFERHGLEVELRREASWATIRDKVALGLLDAAQMLAPMPLASTLGIDSVNVPMIAAMTLDLNGNAITLSQALWREIETVAPDATPPLEPRVLAEVVRRRAQTGRPPLALASVFPFSSHNYLLRLWLASGGIDPDRDVRLSVVPPPHTVAHLSGGVIDGYCVGEPWNQQAEQLGIGRIAVTGHHLWKAMPEKVLGTTEAWAERHPGTLTALVKALLEACAWLDEPANRAEAARILSAPRYVNAPVEVIARSLDLPGFHIFHCGDANFPWRSHADWFLAQMVRWGQAGPRADLGAIADRVFRTDLFRAAAAQQGLACPVEDRRPAGAHGEPVPPPLDKPSLGTSVQEIANG
jgi:ABC-type nitrate/sulfonate/bicarbonate transport system substrate-binding protein